MSSLEECPECGKLFERVSSHKGSKLCQANQNERTILREDLIAVRSESYIEWLKQSRYRLELMYISDYSGNVTEVYHTTSEGLAAVKDHVLINPRSSPRAEIKSKKNGLLFCKSKDGRLSDRKLIVVDPDTDVDLSRKRVTYLKLKSSDPDIAFTSDGERIGKSYKARESIEEIDNCKSELFANII